MSRKALHLLVLLLLAAGFPCRAQFYVNGTEKFTFKWNSIKTADYNFIYPYSCDSLARTFAREWEKWKLPVGNSIGRYPNEMYRSRLDVVLHPYSAYSNGMVVWTPRRMEMYTAPDMYRPDPMPWVTQLAIHEQRHVSQMQFTRENVNLPFTILGGELFAGPLSLLYFDPAVFEGDAVTAETALSNSGRARTADFLEFYRASTLEGQMRNYERWRYGSHRLYTPDYYKIGYLMTGGVRVAFADPLFARDGYFSNRTFYGFVKKELRTNVKNSFTKVITLQDSLWRADEVARAPFQPAERLTDVKKWFTSCEGLTYCKGMLYTKCQGLVDNEALVRVDPLSGKIRRVKYSSALSNLSSDGERIYWSELRYNPRWEMASSSVVRYYNGRSVRTLGSRAARYYNPKPTSNGDVLVCETAPDGSCYVTLLSGADGREISRVKAPDGLTPFEAVEADGQVYCVAQSEAGQGIYKVPEFECVLDGGPVKINSLFSVNDKLTQREAHDTLGVNNFFTSCKSPLYFTSDRLGVNELYALDPDNREAIQLTNLPLGGKDFCFGDDGYLYFTILESSGRGIWRTPVDSLPLRRVEFSQRYSYPIEDELSRQERILAESKEEVYNRQEKIDTPPAKHYPRTLHLLKIHSWLPLYLDYDEVSSQSMEQTEQAAGAGATAFFQNTLGTFYGSVGYNAALDSTETLNHSFMVQATYRGFYPVFEDKFLFNTTAGSYTNYFRTYIPLNYSSGGWTRGVIPYYNLSYHYIDSGWRYTTTQLGVRAYTMLPATSSRRYPKWGIGTNLSIKNLAYCRTPAYTLYGYIPGPAPDQGFALSYSHDAEGVYIREIAYRAPVTYSDELSAAWSIPCFSVDWSGLSPVVYVRNFELTPRASFSHYRLGYSGPRVEEEGFIDSYNVTRLGTDFTVLFGNLLFIPYTIRFGVGAYYVHDTSGTRDRPYDISMILSVDI